MRVKSEIESLGENFLIVSEEAIFISEETRILDANHEEIAFSDLETGMLVVVRAVARDDGNLLATKIEVKS